MDVLVVGAGSLGSLIGGLLADAHDVTLLGRQPHVDAVASEGLSITTAFDRHVRPAAATTPPASTDLALVTTAAHDTAGAAATLDGVDCDVVCSLQNGLGNEATLAETVDAVVLAGTCTYGADLASPGEVACTGVGEVAIGPRPGAQATDPTRTGAGDAGSTSRVSVDPDSTSRVSVDPDSTSRVSVDPDSTAPTSPAASGDDGVARRATDRVANALREGDVVVRDHADMRRPLWSKLAVNAGVNAPTALADVDNGALAAGPAAPVARDAAREVARVARANGVDLPTAAALDRLASVVDATAANRSSMRQALAAGDEPEVEAIYGAVLERAAAPAEADDAIAVPVTRTLAGLVRARAAGDGANDDAADDREAGDSDATDGD